MLHGFTVVWHRFAMTTTEDPSVTVKISETPVYDYTRSLAIGQGFDPAFDEPECSDPNPRQVTAAKRLTTQVWNRICRAAAEVDWSNPDARLITEEMEG